MGRCLTPEKKPYASQRAAKQAIRTLDRNRASGGHGRLHVYRCAAGHWHIGHRT